MSDERRAFAPTPNRLARAKREGDRPRSQELTTVAAFACALGASAAVIVAVWRCAAESIATAARGEIAVREPAATIGLALFPLAAGAAGACAVAIVDGGVHVGAPSIQWQRLDPVAGVRRMFSRETVVAAARAACAFGVAVVALVPLGRALFEGALRNETPASFFALAAETALHSATSALAVGATFAVADRFLAHRRWRENLRMSHEELKRDVRETEGDPHAKGRRTALHRALVRGSIARIREATFVVANPEHVAIGLKYDPPEVAVPEIVTRASGEAAQQVKARARALGIPIVEDVALARALFAQGEAGEPIPRELYVAVAAIVAALAHQGALT